MAILLRILVLAAVVPLLMPAGVCLCAAVGVPCVGGEHHHEHGPEDCCPAVTETAVPVAVAVPAPDLASAPLVVADLAATAVVAARLGASHVANWPAAPPLYVSHCALVL